MRGRDRPRGQRRHQRDAGERPEQRRRGLHRDPMRQVDDQEEHGRGRRQGHGDGRPAGQQRRQREEPDRGQRPHQPAQRRQSLETGHRDDHDGQGDPQDRQRHAPVEVHEQVGDGRLGARCAGQGLPGRGSGAGRARPTGVRRARARGPRVRPLTAPAVGVRDRRSGDAAVAGRRHRDEAHRRADGVVGDQRGAQLNVRLLAGGVDADADGGVLAGLDVPGVLDGQDRARDLLRAAGQEAPPVGQVGGARPQDDQRRQGRGEQRHHDDGQAGLHRPARGRGPAMSMRVRHGPHTNRASRPPVRTDQGSPSSTTALRAARPRTPARTGHARAAARPQRGSRPLRNRTRAAVRSS